VKRAIPSLLLSLLALTLAGCNSTNHSPSDPGAAPQISKLQNSDKVTRLGAQEGVMSLGFDFADPDADIAFYVLTTSTGQVRNPLSEATGRTAGAVSLLQSMFIPERGTMRFTVQVEDNLGHRSNTLEGTYLVE